jgi:transposase-like protein
VTALNDEQRAQAAERFDAGESLSAIARDLGVSHKTVGRALYGPDYGRAANEAHADDELDNDDNETAGSALVAMAAVIAVGLLIVRAQRSKRATQRAHIHQGTAPTGERGGP